MPSGGGGGGEAGRWRRRAPAGAAAAAAAAAVGLLVALPAPGAAQVPDAESAFLARIAAERTAAGHGRLALADDLVTVARRHAAAMAAQGRLHHNPELGAQVANWVRVGENVGRGPDVDAVHAALMASTTHRAEILAPWFSEVGVGVVSSDGALWVTQVFRQPDHAAAPSPSPSPSPSTSASPSPSSPHPPAGPAAAPTAAAPATVPPGAPPTVPARRRAASPATAPPPPVAPAPLATA
ncbi:MAG: CAP domain-containing protein, partial [Acidimicrobiia bacterium]